MLVYSSRIAFRTEVCVVFVHVEAKNGGIVPLPRKIGAGLRNTLMKTGAKINVQFIRKAVRFEYKICSSG